MKMKKGASNDTFLRTQKHFDEKERKDVRKCILLLCEP